MLEKIHIRKGFNPYTSEGSPWLSLLAFHTRTHHIKIIKGYLSYQRALQVFLLGCFALPVFLLPACVKPTVSAPVSFCSILFPFTYETPPKCKGISYSDKKMFSSKFSSILPFSIQRIGRISPWIDNVRSRRLLQRAIVLAEIGMWITCG
jgi:hypothetical protein